MIRTDADVLAALVALPAGAAPQQQQLADRAREVARQMAICPVKAIHFPSGEIDGDSAARSVMGVGSPPSMGTRQRIRFPLERPE